MCPMIAPPVYSSSVAHGMRKNGKQWHEPRKPLRPQAGNTSYKKRAEERKAMAIVKAKENEMKQEKESARKSRIEAILTKRAAKEENLRFEKMAETMHKKRVERLKRREKRNKMIKS